MGGGQIDTTIIKLVRGGERTGGRGGVTIPSLPCPPSLLRSLFFERHCVGDDDGNSDDDNEDEDVGRGRAIILSDPQTTAGMTSTAGCGRRYSSRPPPPPSPPP